MTFRQKIVNFYSEILMEVKDPNEYLHIIKNLSSKEIADIERKPLGQSENPDCFLKEGIV